MTRPAAATVAGPPENAHPTPRLVEGITLLGEYSGRGYREPPHLARRADGTVVQLHPLVYAVAEAVDGSRDAEAIAREVSSQNGTTLDADNVERILDTKLRPTGVVTARDGSSPDIDPADPLLALRLKVGVIPPRMVGAITRLFTPLFHVGVIVVALGGLAVFDGWLFFVHGIGQSTRATMQEPLLFLVVLGLILVSAAFHEIGHASGLRAGGGHPGKMGAGIYLAWPAFYTDVTDAYRLPRSGRLRTDLGGIYFNALFVLATAGVFLFTGSEPLLLVAYLLQIEIVHQLLPLLRLDGYYVLADLIGVPDLFRRVKPVLKSLVPGRHDPSVDALTPMARRVVGAWVLALVPFLLVNMVLIVLSLPKIVGTAWSSADRLLTGWGDAAALDRTVVVVQLVALSIPILGLGVALFTVAKRVLTGLWSWSSKSSPRRAIALAGAALLFGGLAYVWWPDGGFSPYDGNDRGTVQEAAGQVVPLGSGVPIWSAGANRESGSGSNGTGLSGGGLKGGDGGPNGRPSAPGTGSGGGTGNGSSGSGSGGSGAGGGLPGTGATVGVDPPAVGGTDLPGASASASVSPPSTQSPVPSATASASADPTTAPPPSPTATVPTTPSPSLP